MWFSGIMAIMNSKGDSASPWTFVSAMLLPPAVSSIFFSFFTPWEFFTSADADVFPREFEWQQVSSTLHDSSVYSSRSQQCCSLDSLYLSSYSQVLQSLYQSFGDCTKSTNYNWRHRPTFFFFFQFHSKDEVLIPLYTIFQFCKFSLFC